jgi:hypothetical protein
MFSKKKKITKSGNTGSTFSNGRNLLTLDNRDFFRRNLESLPFFNTALYSILASTLAHSGLYVACLASISHSYLQNVISWKICVTPLKIFYFLGKQILIKVL